MRPAIIIILTACMVVAVWILCAAPLQAQYFPPWAPVYSAIYPWYYFNPFPLYPVGFYGVPVPPVVVTPPFLVEPGFRIANAPVTLTIPTVSTTAAPLTAILNLLDPAVLASNIGVLTTNFPLVFDLLVTTFQLPI